jgi:uncharacterized protein YegJ (DUF2314 family)
MRSRCLLFGVLAVPCVVMAIEADKARAGTGLPDDADIFAPDDPEMLAAYERARRTLGEFIATLDRKADDVNMLAVKIPIVDDKAIEYFWINDLSHNGDQFSGNVANDPAVVRTVAFGQRISFPRSEIVDWHYVRDGRMLGSFTTCVQYGRLDPRKARKLERKIGLSCDEGA